MPSASVPVSGFNSSANKNQLFDIFDIRDINDDVVEESKECIEVCNP